MSVAFLVTTLVVVATPGTGAVYSLNAGISRGGRAGLVAALGCTLGVVPHLLAAVTGLAAVLHRSAIAFQALTWAGVGYLLHLAWQALRRHAVDLDPGTRPPRSSEVIRTAVLVNLLNPKLTVFFLAFLPQFVAADRPDATWRMLGLGAVFMAVTFVVFAAYGLFAASIRDQVQRRPVILAWLGRGFAATYVALAGRLALQSR